MATPVRTVDGGGIDGATLKVFDSLPSTNQWVLDHPDTCGHGDVICAIRQTQGRGRFQREWAAPDDHGLTCTFVIDPERPPGLRPTALTQATAIGLRSALGELGFEASLKWPNDLLISGKKVAGILAESVPHSSLVAIGIGLNVNLDQAELDTIDIPATSLLNESGKPGEIETILRTILDNLERSLPLAAADRSSELAAEWRLHDALSGTRIIVKNPDQEWVGDYVETYVDGTLRMRNDKGEELVLYSGDVTIVRALEAGNNQSSRM